LSLIDDSQQLKIKEQLVQERERKSFRKNVNWFVIIMSFWYHVIVSAWYIKQWRDEIAALNFQDKWQFEWCKNREMFYHYTPLLSCITHLHQQYL